VFLERLREGKQGRQGKGVIRALEEVVALPVPGFEQVTADIVAATQDEVLVSVGACACGPVNHC
jgi:hypothetical protein